MGSRGLFATLLLSALVLGGSVAGAWLSPTLRERVLLLGLASGVPPLQGAAARALEDNPTQPAALALVAFVNWAHQPPVDLRRASHVLAQPDRASEADLLATLALLERAGCVAGDPAPELARLARDERRGLLACLEHKKQAWDELRRTRLELAGEGFRSLCKLTGHTFETRCQIHAHGGAATWGSLTDAEWSRALGALNGWAVQTFGGELLASAAGSPAG